MVKEEIINALKEAVHEVTGVEVEPEVFKSADERHGDYSTNVAMAVFGNKELGIKNQGWKTPLELAQSIVEIFNSKFIIHNSFIDHVDVVNPGFINFWLSSDYLITQLQEVLEQKEQFGTTSKSSISGNKIMVEFAHPNTHKEMHIGHMRTLITGEALARILKLQGAKVFRANYQGDIGPHVAKALFGIKKIMEEEKLSLNEIEKWTAQDKVHFLGRGYIRGNQDYEENKEEIEKLNTELYKKESKDWDLYLKTRQWSLDYYDEFYTRFYTKFDRLFFESEMVECGKKIVEENIGKVFVKDQGAVIFKGEEYGLHTRVFITKAGNPTYEGKDMCLGFKEYEAFSFDKNIHVVGSEQAGYFKVIIKALELLDPQKFKGTQYHLSMGMVNIVGMKISSRTGEILRVDTLIEKVKEKVESLMKEGKIAVEGKEKVLEQITIGAIKYSVLKVNAEQNVEFDIEKSVSIEGNSGPYLQYTYARTQSVLAKYKELSIKYKELNWKFEIGNLKLEIEELSLLRSINQFTEVVSEAAEKLSPNLLANYLFDLSQKFNLFYQKHKIIESEKQDLRVAVTNATGQILKNGLYLLGIEAPERM